MATHTESPQDTEETDAKEPRIERVTIAVTCSEKAMIEAVAAAKGTKEGPLFRDLSLEGIKAEYERIRSKFAVNVTAA